MSNKEKKANNQNMDTSMQQSNLQQQGFRDQLGIDNGAIRNRSDSERSAIRERYTNNNNFMPSGMQPNSSGWFDTSSMPGANEGGAPDFSEARGGYSKLAQDGGVNRSDFNPALDSYKGFMSNGGVDATALRQRATGQIPAFYDAYKRNASRRANVQGGYSPGFDAQQAEIGREAGRMGFEASRQVEGDIADKVQQGKMFGTTGYGGLMSNITGMEQQGKIAGLGGLTNIGSIEGSLGESRAGRNQQMQQFLLNQYQQGGMGNARGLQDLYSSRSGEMDQGLQAWLQSQGQQRGHEANLFGIRAGNKGIDWAKWGQIGAGVGSAAIAASSSEKKTDITPISTRTSVSEKLKNLKLYNWKYKGDKITHMGPIAEDFQKTFGVGDGKTLHLADVMGVVLASQQEALGIGKL